MKIDKQFDKMFKIITTIRNTINLRIRSIQSRLNISQISIDDLL